VFIELLHPAHGFFRLSGQDADGHQYIALIRGGSFHGFRELLKRGCLALARFQKLAGVFIEQPVNQVSCKAWDSEVGNDSEYHFVHQRETSDGSVEQRSAQDTPV
jgi:hypothetical protein